MATLQFIIQCCWLLSLCCALTRSLKLIYLGVVKKDICPPPSSWPPAHVQSKRTIPGGVNQWLRSPRRTSTHVLVACLYIRKWCSSLFFITRCPLYLEWPSLLRCPSVRPAGSTLHPSGCSTKLTSQTLSRGGGFRSWEPFWKACLHVHSPFLPGLPGTNSVLPLLAVPRSHVLKSSIGQYMRYTGPQVCEQHNCLGKRKSKKRWDQVRRWRENKVYIRDKIWAHITETLSTWMVSSDSRRPWAFEVTNFWASR